MRNCRSSTLSTRPAATPHTERVRRVSALLVEANPCLLPSLMVTVVFVGSGPWTINCAMVLDLPVADIPVMNVVATAAW